MAAPLTVKKVLVTGCSSGIGLATAEFLKARDWEVFPTARKEEDLEMLREKGFDPVSLDIANADSVKAAAAEVKERSQNQLGAIVNNAGFGQGGAMEDLTREAMLYQFQVNVFGLQELTNQFVADMREAGAGRIVNVSSVVGRVSLPFFGIYSASKFALEAMSDAMRVELKGSGIALSIIEPGPIITEFRNTALNRAEVAIKEVDSVFKRLYLDALEERKTTQKEGGDMFSLAPEAVAKKIAHALESKRPKRRYCVTVPAYAGAFMRRFAPYSLVDAVLSSKLKS